MPIPTEPIGSIPRSPALIQAMGEFRAGRLAQERMDALYTEALRDTIRKFEETGSPVITDGEQTKPSFATYPIQGAHYLAADGVTIPFNDGHTRQLPRLTSGPFAYQRHAESYLKAARALTQTPVKQAVISASALSLIYPQGGIENYPQDAFLKDLIAEAEADIRGCLDNGACNVQIDFTEGRLSVKLDPSKQLLRSFIDLNNRVLERFQCGSAPANRSAYLSRRRSGFHSQGRCRLQGITTWPIRSKGWKLLCTACQRKGARARSACDQGGITPGSAGVRRRG
jgi:5-methyltetrahydropteroyltriglutamate--homocysteine methyltransferase